MSVTIATDLDRTLFPNGNQPYDDTMPLFRRIVDEKKLPLIFVTGRHLSQIRDGIREFGGPVPEWAVAEVGTKLYRRVNDTFEEDRAFIEFIIEHTRNWDTGAFRNALSRLPLRLQPEEHQNRFKLSYFVDDPADSDRIRRDAENELSRICPDAHIIWSVDETLELGLLDVLPRKANKMEALEYLRQRLDVSKDEIIYCGDSGNDLIPLTNGYRAILVANAIDDVRADVMRIADERGIKDRIYLASGIESLSLNGNYVSGILEGLRHFGVINDTDLRPN